MEKASWEENGIKPYFFSKRLFFYSTPLLSVAGRYCAGIG